MPTLQVGSRSSVSKYGTLIGVELSVYWMRWILVLRNPWQLRHRTHTFLSHLFGLPKCRGQAALKKRKSFAGPCWLATSCDARISRFMAW
jgi:hypothetical protein